MCQKLEAQTWLTSWAGQTLAISWAISSLSPIGAMSRVEIKTVHIIKNDNMKKTMWTPTVRTVENVPFIEIARWSRHLTLFVTGKALDLRKQKQHQMKADFFHVLLKHRNDASTEAYYEATKDEANEGKQKKRKVKPGDHLVAPQCVDVIMPAAGGFGERTAKCLWGVGAMPLWLEMDAVVLEHLRVGILHFTLPEGDKPPAKKRRISKDC